MEFSVRFFVNVAADALTLVSDMAIQSLPREAAASR